MDINKLSQKLKEISVLLKNDKTCEKLIENFKDYDPNIKNMYYDSLDPLNANIKRETMNINV